MPSVIKGDSNVNLDFSTGGRITGDFSNATAANRVSFQSSTTNGNTIVPFIPNGTATQTNLALYNGSDVTTNFSLFTIRHNTTSSTFASAIGGTGAYVPMTFETGGSERMRVDTSGNVGIGTSSPTVKLEVYDASSAVARVTAGTEIFEIRNTGSEVRLAVVSADPMTFRTSNVEAMRIDSSGNVGIGTTSTTGNRFYAYTNSGHAGTFYANGGGSTTGLNSYGITLTGNMSNGGAECNIVYGSAGAGLAFNSWSGTTLTERMRIDSSGNLLVGTTATTPNPGIGLFPAGNITVGNSAGGSGFEFHTFRRSGTQIGSITQNGTTAVAYNTSSDYRLKYDIEPMTGALAKVAALKPCIYKWNADDSAGEGFIAHELAEVCPSAVTGEKDAVDADGNPQYQGIDTSFLVATLTAAIQELKAIVDAQGAEIAALKGAA